MDDENKSVEITNEPKIESRFGFQKSTRGLSKGTIKILMVGAAISLGTIMWVRTPDKPESESSGVSMPETSEVGASQIMSVETYSAEAEKNQINDRNKKSSRRVVVVKLPGLQKIDRTRTAQSRCALQSQLCHRTSLDSLGLAGLCAFVSDHPMFKPNHLNAS